MIVQKIVVVGPLVQRALLERFTNGKTVVVLTAKDKVSKSLEDE